MTNSKEILKRLNARRREIEAMIHRFPQLATFGGSVEDIAKDVDPHINIRDMDNDDLQALFKAYCETIPTFHEPAREAQIRNALFHFRNAAQTDELRKKANRALAKSDIRSGVIHSVIVRQHPDLWDSVRDLVAQHDAAYGASIFSRTWESLSRGKALTYYFASHENLLEGKKILHIAPEGEARDWFQSRASALNMTYTTLNLGGDVDFIEDLTALDIPDQSFDWIISHRVLEHIFDDMSAIRETYRVLKPGGIFNVSVPESMQLPKSEEWLIPDYSHHHHYRQYGANFADLLSSAGFEVEPVNWLVKQSIEKLDAAGTYPLRIYNAQRPD